jgi:glutaredoxin
MRATRLEATRQPVSPVTVYWKPGCRYCTKLRRDLRRIGLETNQVNIWETPEAAAALRTLAGGNETVPTVLVGKTKTTFVNPSVAGVLDTAREVAPGLITGEVMRRARRQRALSAAQVAAVGAVLAASLAADVTGRAMASWALDGVAW